ncbi:MAG: hypothetical protein LBE38_05340 [Deltaproteobacteria bacterium]|jgi:hypothetical protein|nr:hypothetical protein [Deltaproteobacteria bacterium]
MPYIYSGFCLAAMFGSIIYEHHLIKKEEKELCERMRLLAERTRNTMGTNSNPPEFTNIVDSAKAFA